MNVVFLDIDGVLNNAKTQSKCPSGFTGISNNLLKRLKKIVHTTNSRIVLTSTWKDCWNKNPLQCDEDGMYLNRKLKQQGMFVFDKVQDISKTNSSYRGWSIMKYLNENDWTDNWVVLDDFEFDFETYPEIMNNFVQTNPVVGITNEDVEKAIEILNPGQQ